MPTNTTRQELLFGFAARIFWSSLREPPPGSIDRCATTAGVHEVFSQSPPGSSPLHPTLIGKTPLRVSDRSEQAVDGDSEDAQRALIFQAFCCLVEFLQGHLGVLEQTFIIDELAYRPLAFVNLLQDLL